MVVTNDGYEVITEFPIGEIIECWYLRSVIRHVN